MLVSQGVRTGIRTGEQMQVGRNNTEGYYAGSRKNGINQARDENEDITFISKV